MTTDLRTVADLLASLRATLLARIPELATSPLAELDMLRAAHERAVRDAVLRERIACTRIIRDACEEEKANAYSLWIRHATWVLDRVLRAIERRGTDG